jgi:hypothetical protein
MNCAPYDGLEVGFGQTSVYSVDPSEPVRVCSHFRLSKIKIRSIFEHRLENIQFLTFRALQKNRPISKRRSNQSN